jgi:hypothetical protein
MLGRLQPLISGRLGGFAFFLFYMKPKMERMRAAA